VPTARGKLVANQWYVPSDSEIDFFFGESGMHWTPKRWKSCGIVEGIVTRGLWHQILIHKITGMGWARAIAFRGR
jgi:hypothetical protein